MRKSMGLLLGMMFAGAFAVGFTSCDQAENALDCNSICDKYKQCWNNSYDEGACRSSCRDKANNDMDFERKVDMCASCIEGRSCGGTFACITECAGVVP